MQALQTFVKVLSQETLELFKRRLFEGYDLVNDSHENQLYRAYKELKLLSTKDECDIIQGANSSTLAVHVISENHVEEICNNYENIEEEDINNAAPIPRTSSPVPGPSGLQAQPHREQTPEELPDIAVDNQTTPPKYYVNCPDTPFSKHLQIDTSVEVLTTRTATRSKLPSAISGEEYFKFMEKKLRDKESKQNEKETRKQERLEKKKQKELEKKTKRKIFVEAESSDESTIQYDNDDDDDLIEENAGCDACGGDERRR